MTSQPSSGSETPVLIDDSQTRHLGLVGATGIGVGAIVGGGILALAGVAFATTGPSAVIAFVGNGVIALMTALVFAEMASSYPESGGTYTFAKKVLSVEAAFMVGWVVWFASIVAAVLYALGFAAFFEIFLTEIWTAALGPPPYWLRGHGLDTALALAATALYAGQLARSQCAGGRFETIGKLVLFAILIAAGLWALPSREPAELREQLTPFFMAGAGGLLQAMGYTFIALQGFDLIAAVGGDVKDPSRNLPRSMIGSLLIALAIYIPLLLLVSTVGIGPGEKIGDVAAADPEAVVAFAVETYLGRTGFWLVIVAALLSMLSALQANLLAASHIALAMARDRNLPASLRRLDPSRGTPVAAVLLTAATVGTILLVVPSVAAAGAMSSLIFLLSFALVHGMGILSRRRGGGREDAFLVPFFPLVPLLGGGACLALAVFQSVAVPAAVRVAAVWLGLGAALYLLVFSRRARVADASAEALDPNLLRSRGRNPLVLVPIANPASVASLVGLASAMAPPRLGRVLLLYVAARPTSWSADEPPPQLAFAQQVLGQALTTSFRSELAPEALTTIADEPWEEIRRVADTYSCESLLLGLGDLTVGPEPKERHLVWLLREVTANVVVLGAPIGWQLDQVRRVLVPAGGRRDQSYVRARMLGALCRSHSLEITYLGIVTPEADNERELTTALRYLMEDEVPGHSRYEVVRHESVIEAIVEAAKDADLVILGLQRRGKAFGEITSRIAREAGTAVLLIGQN